VAGVATQARTLADNPAKKQYGRYRLAVGITYLSLVGIAVAYLVASISASLLHRHRSHSSRPPIGARPRPDEIIACHREVQQLFADLNARFAEFPVRLGQENISARTAAREGQAAWRARWREVGQHCRFAELARTGLGAGFDQLAAVHTDLEELDIGYQSLQSRFVRQLAPGVEDIRRTLAASRQSLEAQARQAGAPPAPPQ
jgi:hypothetical protein